MASVYTNDLRLEEIGSGEQSGTWGDTTNTNLELIAEAFSFGTEAITTNADTHTTTIADGATDPGRSIYLKYTGTLDSACTITLGPNTVSKVWFIENATSGSQNIIISQGSGANVTIGNGAVKMVYSDGAGSGAAVVDALVDLDLTGTTTVAALTASGAITASGVITGTTLEATGDTSSGDNAAIGYTSTEGLILTGQGSTGDVTIKNDADATVIQIPTGTTGVDFKGNIFTSTSGTSNFVAGVNAGNSITSGGNYNVLIGDEAGTALTTGDNNVAIGFEALSTEDANGNNVAIGYRSLKTLNAGAEAYTTAVGLDSGTSLTTGVRNTIMGAFTGDALTDADYNVAIGYCAGYSQGSSSDFNVLIGRCAGRNLIGNSSNNLSTIGAQMVVGVRSSGRSL